jgi:hypothetical protein
MYYYSLHERDNIICSATSSAIYFSNTSSLYPLSEEDLSFMRVCTGGECPLKSFRPPVHL